MVDINKTVEKRIVIIDALRGFALLGIILIHYNHWFIITNLPDTVLSKNTNVISKIADLISSNLIRGKFYFLFSFIFGLSFYLHTRYLKKYYDKIDTLLFRRALCLFIIGCIHNAFWSGDILGVYAILMIPIIFMRNLSDKIILILAILFILDVPNILFETYKILNQSNTQIAANTVSKEYIDPILNIISQGNLHDIIAYNFHNISDKCLFLVLSGRLSITTGFFLLGIYAGKKEWIPKLHFALNKIIYVLICSFVLLISFQLIGVKLNHTTSLNANLIIYIKFIVIFIQNINAIVFYTMLVVLIYERKHNGKLVTTLSNLGKMSLTNYLVQTYIGILLFYHIGFGLFMKTNPANNFVIALAVLFIQAMFSNIWFQYFNYGIVEWLLRAGTFLKFQEMWKSKILN